MSVPAAAALANGGDIENAEPGLEFFAQLNEAGNFVPVIATFKTSSPKARRPS